MKHFLRGIGILLLLTMVVAPLLSTNHLVFAQDEEATCDAIVFLGGWSRPAVALDGTGNGAGYGIFVNLGEEDDTLVSVSSEAASVIELHTVIMDGDVMQMTPLEDGMPIPAGGFTSLQPGGYHIMMIGLTADLEPDAEVSLDLEFEHADPINITYTVQIEAPSSENSVLGISGDTSGCEEVGFYGATAKPTTEESNDSSVYGLFLNLGDEAYTLTGVSTPITEMSRFADVEEDNPEHVTVEEVEVPANGFTLLSAGSLHVHLTDVSDGLAPEDMFELTFTYSDDLEQTVMVMVQAPDMAMDMGDMDHNHGDDMDMDSDESHDHGDDDMDMDSEE